MTAVSAHGLASSSRSKSLDHSNQSSGEDAHLLDSGMDYSVCLGIKLPVQIWTYTDVQKKPYNSHFMV